MIALADFTSRLPDLSTDQLRALAHELHALTLKGRLDGVLSLLYQAPIAAELHDRGDRL